MDERMGETLRGLGRRLGSAAAQGIGDRVDGMVVAHHRRRLRSVGWEHAMDGSEIGWSRRAMRPTQGNALSLLVDGSTMLPALAEALQAAQSHVHIAGWHFSPELDLTRGADPVILRNVLADLAERIDVRILGWKGSPLAVFRPSRGDVARMVERLTCGNRVEVAVDDCVRHMHCHHEKAIVIDDRIAFVGGIDLTLDGGDPFDTPRHRARGRIGWHDVAVRVEGPVVADVAEHFRMRWHGATRQRLQPPARPEQRDGVGLQLVRTVPERVYTTLRDGEFSVLESYLAAFRSATKLIYIENQFLWSPEVVAVLADKLRKPPADEFRLVVLLPAHPNDGADVSRGQVAALIAADDGNGRFLATTIYARHGGLRDLIYVHAKIAVVDDQWLTVGSANLNEHSLFNDSELNLVCLDPERARAARLQLWAEHLELDRAAISGDPTAVVDTLWQPIADEQLERIRSGSPLTHRLVKLPGVSKRRARLSGSLQGRIVDG
jgi:phosphatidylserine/phosphatidylglycerophosphate/cardiolipin synthase-like enzyme